MGNNVFTIMSLFYSLIINLSFFFKKRIKNIETNLYSCIIICNLINIITAMLFYYVKLYEINDILDNILAKCVIICFYTFSYLFHLYVLYLAKNINDNGKIFNNKRIVSLYFVLMIPIFMLPINCYHNGNVIYSYGLCANYEYLIISIMIIYWFILFIKNFKNIVRKKCIPIFTFVTLLIIVAVIQKIKPELLLLTSLETVVIYLMYFTIENPDMKLLNEIHKSKEISDNANEEKTLFIYNMSQDMREITSKINDEANNILDTNLLEDTKESARNILSYTSNFNTTINEILDTSSLEASNLKVYNNKYNIKTLIKELITIYDKTSKNKEIKFITNIDHNIPELLYGDNISLKEVLNVILSNSVKYTTEGYVEFSVNTIIKNDVCRLIMTIEDSGPGIKGDEINEIKMSNKSLGKANKMITVMNGTMMISSDYGMGTKVKIILDQKICEDNTSEELKYEEIIDEKNILMVDDSEAGIKIVEKHLKGSNIKLEAVKNGKDCLNKVKANKYDLILIDEKLSSVSGEYLLSKMKTIRNFNTKVILLTKDTSNEYKEDYLNLGFTDYILKPIKKEELLSKISKYTKKGS